MLENPAKREELIAFLRSALPPETLNNPIRLIYENRIRNDDEEFKIAIETFSQTVITEIGSRRVYCLTPFPASTLMWSHYASRHRGICLEFDKNNHLIESARPVRYRKTYPEWTPQNAMAQVLELVLTKSMDWCYEREFRIIATSVDGPTKLHGNFVLLPPGALTSIIVGCESRDYAEILSIVKDHAPWVPIKRAARVPNHYNLNYAQNDPRSAWFV